jgi:hypothetical protein
MTIPASAVVQVNPGVLSPGGAALVMNGLVLTENLLMPTGSVLSFANAQAVSNFFGPASAEYAYAQIYFAGYNNSTQLPSAILFAPYNAAARSGWLQSGSFASITLAQLQAITPGTLTITFAGVGLTSSSINLSGASSFSNAASIIQAAFTSPPFTVSWDAVQSCFIFTSTATGAAETIVFATGAIAASLLLTQATGATISQGAVADTPSTSMANAVAVNQNWATVSYITELTLTQKEALAVWLAAQDDEYLGVIWDSDTQASVQGATEPFGVVAKAGAYNSVMCIGGDPAAVPVGSSLAALNLNIAAFVQGMIASINFGQTNGRITLAGKGAASSAVIVNCANLQTYENLLANGYSCYGAFASRNQGFVFFSNGNMPGNFPWVDQYVDEIWLSAALQATLLSLYTTVNAIPYDPEGYGLIRAALLGPINAALNFGAIQIGVVLSSTQVAEVNSQAGVNAAAIIQTNGYYLQILDPGAPARNARTTPIINLWYTDGGAVQQINLASIDIL